jgi:hypothetical protein
MTLLHVLKKMFDIFRKERDVTQTILVIAVFL